MGKGIATVGIWAAVGVVAIYAGAASILVALLAVAATTCVWGE